MRTVFAILVAGELMAASAAAAHDVWADATSVPEWVKDACCGPSDVHHLTSDQVLLTAAGYRIQGIAALVPFAKTLPSQDGEYWIFYRDFPDGTQYVFCFFAPGAGL